MKVAGNNTHETAAIKSSEGLGAVCLENRQKSAGLRVAKMFSWIIIMSARKMHATTCAEMVADVSTFI